MNGAHVRDANLPSEPSIWRARPVRIEHIANENKSIILAVVVH